MEVRIYTDSSRLPKMQYHNFFHSKTLMNTYEQTKRHKPYMVVAFEDNVIVAHMMVVRRNGKCRIFGEGEYTEGADREVVFNAMLSAFTKTMHFPTLYIQVSNLSRKMFAYRYFRKQHYFPIQWLEAHNSLHSKNPKDRITKTHLRKVAYARKMGVVTSLVESEEDLDEFYRTTRRYYNYNLRKFCPTKKFFDSLMNTEESKLFISWYNGRPIATCAIVCTGNESSLEGRDAFLWFAAYKTKSHPRLHPDVITIWNVMNWCYRHNINHFRFMDVGLPFFKNSYYEFLLSFGCKSVGTNRWFHFFPGILNWLLRKIFR